MPLKPNKKTCHNLLEDTVKGLNTGVTFDHVLCKNTWSNVSWERWIKCIVGEVLGKIVVYGCDWSFENLSGSHCQSQVKNCLLVKCCYSGSCTSQYNSHINYNMGGGGEGGRTNQTALKWSIIWMDPKFSIDFMKLYKFLLIIYYIHFEITGYPISLISSLWCNLFTNGTNPIISVWQRQLLQLFTNQLSPESVDYL